MAKRGRKPKGEYQSKSVVFSTRLRPDTKKALEKSAQKSGRSLSQEVEHRLRRSFDEDQDLFERFGGRQNYALMRMIGAATNIVWNPLDPDKSWLEDPYVFQQTVNAMNAILEAFRPEGDPKLVNPAKPNDDMFELLTDIQGEDHAGWVLYSVANADANLQIDLKGNKNLAALIKSNLGSLIERVQIDGGWSKAFLRAAEELERREKKGKKK